MQQEKGQVLYIVHVELQWAWSQPPLQSIIWGMCLSRTRHDSLGSLSGPQTTNEKFYKICRIGVVWDVKDVFGWWIANVGEGRQPTSQVASQWHVSELLPAKSSPPCVPLRIHPWISHLFFSFFADWSEVAASLIQQLLNASFSCFFFLFWSFSQRELVFPCVLTARMATTTPTTARSVTPAARPAAGRMRTTACHVQKEGHWAAAAVATAENACPSLRSVPSGPFAVVRIRTRLYPANPSVHL